MIPRTFPSIIEALQTKMVVYVLPSITGLTAWIDYIPVKGVTTESNALANTYATDGYQVVKTIESLTGKQAWLDYIPVFESAAYNKPWSTDAGGYIPAGGLFSVASLFAAGEQGTWYDPSDLTTLFQDSAGTIPVTAVQQPVGLMLDKSKGLVLGPELVVNGDFSNGTTGWSLVGSSVSITGGKGIFTSTPASTDYIRTLASVAALKTYVIEFDAVITSGAMVVELPFVLAISQVSVSGHYKRYFYASTASPISFRTGSSLTGTIDNISIKELPGNHAFQTTSASRPVLQQDGSGKFFLLFDGVDDSLVTNSINFTGTDKMTVFAGVRKLSDAARGMLIELSATTASNNGAFAMTAPDAASATYAFESDGTILTSAVGTPFTAPLTSVLTGIGNISGDVTTLRVNGTQAATNTGDQGTGNFGNYPLFIGRRNQASLPFNGHLYSLIVRGAASTTAQITSTETYVNQKTGAY